MINNDMQNYEMTDNEMQNYMQNNIQSNVPNNYMQNSQSNINDERYNQLKFLEHAAYAEHYARQKMANAANDTAYYMFAELEYYHRSQALHYKGLFSADSTLKNYQ